MRRLFEGGYYLKYRRRGYYLFQRYHNAATIRRRLLFEVQTSRLLFISALPQCGDYSRVATIRSTDVAATIYFSATAMRRLFEGGYYLKYRRRGYYLFQRYHNAATIRRRLLFEVQTSRLLFISALPQCGDYSRAATIRSTDVAATIYFSSTAMRRLFEGGYYSKYRRRGYYLFQLYRNAATIRGRLLFEVQTSRLLFISALLQCGDYSRAATIRSTDVAATIYFSSTAMRRLFEGGYYSKYRRRGYYLFQRYRNAATIRGRLLFEVQTSRLLFISALPQCGDYSRAATIYFSATAMRRLFEGGYYSKYRRRGYYLFQRYRNAATIRGRLLFEVQTSRLLFISALPQCGDYSRAATIRSTDVAATIYFSATTMRRLFEGGYYLFQRYRNAATIRGRLLFEVQTSRLLFISALPQCGDYSRAATIRSTDVAATIYFSATTMRRLFEGGYYSKYRRRGYYLFQRYHNAATIRGRLLFISALPQCGDYSRAATIRSTDVAATIYFSATAMRRLFEGGYYSKYRRRGYYLFQLYRNAATIRGRLLFEVQTSRLLFISALPQCGDYSRAATIRSTDVAATIYFSSTAMRRLFEGGYYSKYRRRGYYLFQLYRNAATIRGRLLFEVQTSRLLFISALPQCGDYSRAATIRSTDVAATIYFSSTAMRRLFEGGYYSKYRRRGYYLFQLYRNAATIRGRLLFEVQTSRLLFISALPQCGDYSRAATIRSTDVAATIYFSSTAMRRLFEGGYYSKYRRRGYYLFQLYHNAATIRGRLLFEVQTSRLLFISALPQCGDYSRAATIRSTDVAATIYFSSTAMRRLFEGGYYSKYRRRGYYLFQLYRNAATIRGRLLFEVQTSRLLFISALPQCGNYSRAATIRSTDVAATIYFSSTAMRRLFEGGYYSKYRRRGYYLFQRYRNAATIRSAAFILGNTVYMMIFFKATFIFLL